MVEGIQYGGGISSIRWKIFSTDVSHHQYGGASLPREATAKRRLRSRELWGPHT